MSNRETKTGKCIGGPYDGEVVHWDLYPGQKEVFVSLPVKTLAQSVADGEPISEMTVKRELYIWWPLMCRDTEYGLYRHESVGEHEAIKKLIKNYGNK